MRQRRSHARFQTPTKNSATRTVRRSDVRTRLGSRRFNVNDADALGSRGSGPQDLHSSLYFAAALSTLPKDGALTPRPTPGIGASILVMISIASLCWLIKSQKIPLAMYSLVFAFMFANVRCNRRSLRNPHDPRELAHAFILAGLAPCGLYFFAGVLLARLSSSS